MLLVLPSLETRQTLISLVLRLTQYKFYNHTQYIMYIGSWQKRICIESMLLSLINLILNLKWYDACRGQRCRREFALKAFLPVQNHRYSRISDTRCDDCFWFWSSRFRHLELEIVIRHATCDSCWFWSSWFLMIKMDQTNCFLNYQRHFWSSFFARHFYDYIPKHYQGCIFNFVLCSNFKFAGTNLFFHVSALYTPWSGFLWAQKVALVSTWTIFLHFI